MLRPKIHAIEHERLLLSPGKVVSEDTGAKTAMCSAHNDLELHDWLRWAFDYGSGFLKTTAEAALIADLKHYNLLRPVLLELKKEWPKPA